MEEKKPFDEKLLGIANPIMLFCLFLLLPFLAVVLLFRANFGSNFFSNLVIYTGISYVCGGFVVFGIKMWELWDNKFVLFKRARWKSDPILRKVYYKVVVPPNFERTPAEMYYYFGDMQNWINGKRTKFDVYDKGKWYYDWAFDIIVRRGKPEMYMSFPFKRLDFAMKVLKSHYPEIKLIETTDPYEKWPKDWENGKTKLGPYKNFHAWDYKLWNSGLYPLGNPSNLSGNPLGSFLDTLCKFDPETMFVLQYVFRPFPNTKWEEWTKELEEVRKELLIHNTSFEVTDSKGDIKVGAQGDLVSERNKRIVEACESKLGEGHFRVHVRLMTFYPENKGYYGKIIEKIAKIYFGGIGSDKNFLMKAQETSTDRTFSESKWPMLDGIIGPLMNRFYFFKEQIYRGKIQYSSLPDRDPDVAWDSMDMLIDSQSMATMFHWPKLPNGIFMDEWEKIQKLSILPRTIDVEATKVSILGQTKKTIPEISEVETGLISGTNLTDLNFDKSVVEHKKEEPSTALPQKITIEIKNNPESTLAPLQQNPHNNSNLAKKVSSLESKLADLKSKQIAQEKAQEIKEKESFFVKSKLNNQENLVQNSNSNKDSSDNFAKNEDKKNISSKSKTVDNLAQKTTENIFEMPSGGQIDIDL
jgi:hypothetical protein